jgi:acyl carrier protein
MMIRATNPFLLEAINRVRLHKHMPALAVVDASTRFREDCGFDSMDLAELTVIVEAKTGIDLFADSPVRTVGEAAAKLAVVKPVRQ